MQRSQFTSSDLDLAAMLTAAGAEPAEITPSQRVAGRAVFCWDRDDQFLEAMSALADGSLAVDDSEIEKARRVLRARAVLAVEGGAR